MSMTKRASSTTLASELVKSRHEAHLSLIDLTIELRGLLPPVAWVSFETLRRYESGLVPTAKADPVIVAALAVVYGRRLEDLSSEVAEAAEEIRLLLEQAEALPKASKPSSPRGQRKRPTVSSVRLAA